MFLNNAGKQEKKEKNVKNETNLAKKAHYEPVDFQMDFQEEMFHHRKSCKNITLAPLEIKSFLLSW